jgi:predicted transglutaminase-like cysteine proteinase
MPFRLLHVAILALLSACSSTRMATDIPAPAPFGVADYCRDAGGRGDPQDLSFRQSVCSGAPRPAVAVLTPERRRDLEEVQTEINAAIGYRPTTTWDPLAAEGDCKTYSARKELELLRRGWPAGALRIATAFVRDGRYRYQYHAVLLVDTDRGTLVLDNRHDAPLPWDETAYIWMTAQAPGRAGWIRLRADPAEVALALAANVARLPRQISSLP